MTSPIGIQLHNRPLGPPPGPRHDRLHMAEGLRYCWCMCPRCFLKYGDQHGGICVCRVCPCAASYYATLPMHPRRGD